MKKSKIEQLEEAIIARKKELVSARKLMEAKSVKGSKLFVTIIEEHRDAAEISLRMLDPFVENKNLRIQYATLKTLRNGYQHLLDLLANPEKRIEAIENEILKATKEAKLLLDNHEQTSELF